MLIKWLTMSIGVYACNIYQDICRNMSLQWSSCPYKWKGKLRTRSIHKNSSHTHFGWYTVTKMFALNVFSYYNVI